MIKPISAAIDLLPTLADLAGIEMKAKHPLDGKSLKPLLMGEKTEWPNRIHISSWRGNVSSRTQQFRLDSKGQLYDMLADPEQKIDVAKKFPEETARHRIAVAKYRAEVMSKRDKNKRPFLVGHPDYKFTQIPARDGVAHGGIKRSNRHPNCTHFTNWRKTDDKITWEIEVVDAGSFEVDLYYTCPKADVGSTIELSFNDTSLKTQISQAFDPPYIAAAADRDKRIEGDDKEWKPMSMGTITLLKGNGTLTLKATNISGSSVMDFRLLLLKRK